MCATRKQDQQKGEKKSHTANCTSVSILLYEARAGMVMNHVCSVHKT